MSRGRGSKKNKSKQKPIRYSKMKHRSKDTNNKKVKNTTVSNVSKAKPINFDNPVRLVFTAIDTLFFRESRPMESMGELQSVFPPPVRTLAGAVRTLIGEHKQVNWQVFDSNDPVAEFIGYGDDLGRLSFQGAWLSYKGERLYPAPLLLMQKEDDSNPTKTKKIVRLELEKQGVWCDLGRHVRLPVLPEDAAGSKPLENTWLTPAGFEAVLQGKTLKPNDIRQASDLFERESKVGIARDNRTRTVEPSLLYQTQHIRPKKELSIEVDVSGLPNDLPHSNILRLGGEGRMAGLSLKPEHNAFPKSPQITKGSGLLICLLTPLKINQTHHDGCPLPGFIREECENPKRWVVNLNGIELELYGAVTGKSQREGGWDMAKHQPRAVTSLIPAGSVFFCKVKDGNTSAAIKALHNKQIGEMTAYGYGHLAVGIWED